MVETRSQWMVKTRSQKKKLLEMAAGSHIGSNHEPDTTLSLMEKMLLRMEAMETSWESYGNFLGKADGLVHSRTRDQCKDEGRV